MSSRAEQTPTQKSPRALCASSVTSEQKDYVLSVLRVVSARLRLIEAEVNSVGVALSRNLITTSHALLRIEMIAPGCYDQAALAVFDDENENSHNG
jgi:hypothetical protein